MWWLIKTITICNVSALYILELRLLSVTNRNQQNEQENYDGLIWNWRRLQQWAEVKSSCQTSFNPNTSCTQESKHLLKYWSLFHPEKTEEKPLVTVYTFQPTDRKTIQTK